MTPRANESHGTASRAPVPADGRWPVPRAFAFFFAVCLLFWGLIVAWLI